MDVDRDLKHSPEKVILRWSGLLDNTETKRRIRTYAEVLPALFKSVNLSTFSNPFGDDINLKIQNLFVLHTNMLPHSNHGYSFLSRHFETETQTPIKNAYLSMQIISNKLDQAKILHISGTIPATEYSQEKPAIGIPFYNKREGTIAKVLTLLGSNEDNGTDPKYTSWNLRNPTPQDESSFTLKALGVNAPYSIDF